MLSNQKIPVAIIGAGNMSREHIKVFNADKNVEVNGIYSRTYESAKSIVNEYPAIKIYPDIESLASGTKAKLLIIAVSVLSCKEICIEAFKYRWKILIEKPVGYNLEEALAIEEIAKSSKSNVFVALNRRFYSSTIELKRLLDETSGQRYVSINDQQDQEEAMLSGHPEKVVENQMYSHSIHLIDYFSHICRGQMVNINMINSWKKYSSNFVSCELNFSSGDIGFYNAIWNRPGPWSVSVSSSDFYIELKPLENIRVQKKGSYRRELKQMDSCDVEFKPGLFLQAKEAIKAASGINNSLISLSEANNTMKIISSIYDMP